MRYRKKKADISKSINSSGMREERENEAGGGRESLA